MILIVDPDVGFVIWLGFILAQAGRDSLPARNVRQAQLLLRHTPCEVDVLVISPHLAGAAAFAASLLKINASTRIIEVVGSRYLIPNAHARMPVSLSPAAGEEWLKVTGTRVEVTAATGQNARFN